MKKGDLLGKALNPDRLNALATLAQEGAMGMYLKGGRGVRLSYGAQGGVVTMRRRGRRGGGAVVETPWMLRGDGSIVPGAIGLEGGVGSPVIPTIAGTPIAGAAEVPTLTVSGDGYLVAELEFDVTWNGGYLSTPIELLTVKFAILSTVPEDTSTKKYRPFCAINAGVPSLPFYTSASLLARLCGNEANDTTMTLINA